MQLRRGVQKMNLTGGHLSQFWVHSTLLILFQNQTNKTPQWKLQNVRLNSIHLPLGRVDVPLSQAGKYSLFMLCCWPRFLRMTGSVPRKLLSVAEYSSLSAERQICTLESNSAFQPPAAHNERSAVQRREGKKKNKKKKKCEKKWEKCAPEGWAELSHAKLNWTLGPLVRFCEYEADGEREESSFYFALPRRQKK